MFGASVDYRESLRCGTLAPAGVVIDSVRVHTAMSEGQILEALRDNYGVKESETFRSCDQQWAYLRRMARQHDDSMHYYTISPIYYDRQLSGWFKVYDWRLEDLLLRAYLWRPSETGQWRVWLIHADMDTLPSDRISYLESDHLALIRRGNRAVEWNVQRNEVIISSDSDSDPTDD
jgi:hypothetical protein